MTIKASGPLYISEIAAEFGGVIPHHLSEYYGVTPRIPMSGLIRHSDFYGQSAPQRFTVTEQYFTPDGGASTYYGMSRNVYVFGSVSPTHFRGLQIDGMFYYVEAAEFHIKIDGNQPQNLFQYARTEDGHVFNTWNLKSFGWDGGAYGNFTTYAWSAPQGWWDGSGTRWVDLYI